MSPPQPGYRRAQHGIGRGLRRVLRVDRGPGRAEPGINSVALGASRGTGRSTEVGTASGNAAAEGPAHTFNVSRAEVTYSDPRATPGLAVRRSCSAPGRAAAREGARTATAPSPGSTGGARLATAATRPAPPYRLWRVLRGSSPAFHR